MLNDAHGDDLENGEEDRRRCHGRWELQHGRDIGSYLGRGDHPIKHIIPRAASDGLESHEEHHSTAQRLEGKVQYTVFYVIQSSAASPLANENLRAVTGKAEFKGAPLSVALTTVMASRPRVHPPGSPLPVYSLKRPPQRDSPILKVTEQAI
jgi:hypothetical protein